MTVLPGSLDHLYYNGILDCIPYEAYSMPPVGVPRINPGTRSVDYYTPNLRQQIYAEADKADVNKKSDKSYIWKGLIGLSIIAGTIFCLAKKCSGFWKKLKSKNC